MTGSGGPAKTGCHPGRASARTRLTGALLAVVITAERSGTTRASALFAAVRRSARQLPHVRSPAVVPGRASPSLDPDPFTRGLAATRMTAQPVTRCRQRCLSSPRPGSPPRRGCHTWVVRQALPLPGKSTPGLPRGLSRGPGPRKLESRVPEWPVSRHRLGVPRKNPASPPPRAPTDIPLFSRPVKSSTAALGLPQQVRLINVLCGRVA